MKRVPDLGRLAVILITIGSCSKTCCKNKIKFKDLNALRGDIKFMAKMNDSYFEILNAIVVLSHVFHSTDWM